MCLSKVEHFGSCQNSILQLIVVTTLLVASVKCKCDPELSAGFQTSRVLRMKNDMVQEPIEGKYQWLFPDDTNYRRQNYDPYAAYRVTDDVQRERNSAEEPVSRSPKTDTRIPTRLINFTINILLVFVI